jgi:hypothetical protein
MDPAHGRVTIFVIVIFPWEETMIPIQNIQREAYYPLQVAGTIRSTSVAVVKPTPNVVSQIIASGSPSTHATVSNGMAARVDSYTPPPGRNMAHYLAMDVDRAGMENTTVADALQRYLNVSPTRRPGGDPKDIDSHDSYPTLIMGEDQAWQDILPYQFSVNGMVQKQSQPTFFTRAGSLKIRVVGKGVATVTTPATEPGPTLQAGPMPPGAYYPSAVAAQLSMRRTMDLLNEPETRPPITVGPDPNGALEETDGQNLMGAMPPSGGNTVSSVVTSAAPEISERVREGLINFANMGIYKTRPQLFLTAMAASA